MSSSFLDNFAICFSGRFNYKGDSRFITEFVQKIIKMNMWCILFAILLASTATCKYEDQFGKLYDWKQEGVAKPTDIGFCKNSIFEVSNEGFTVFSYGTGTLSLKAGQVISNVDVEHKGYILDEKNERAYFLSKSQGYVQEFEMGTGKFVQTLSSSNG